MEPAPREFVHQARLAWPDETVGFLSQKVGLKKTEQSESTPILITAGTENAGYATVLCFVVLVII